MKEVCDRVGEGEKGVAETVREGVKEVRGWERG